MLMMVGLMLEQRLRRWPSIKPALPRCLVLSSPLDTSSECMPGIIPRNLILFARWRGIVDYFRFFSRA